MKINSTDSVKEYKIKVLINGLSGSGKTTQVTKIQAAGYKPLVVSFESGLLSIAGHKIDYVDGTRDDGGVLIPKELRIDRLMDIYRYILSEDSKKKYDTIYLDSLTEICQCMYDALKKEYPERKDSLVLYGELSQKMRSLIQAFRDIPYYHVVFTCLSKIEKDEFGKRYVGYDLIGSIADKVTQYYDESFYLRVNGEGQREFICQATDTVIAKDRSSKLKPVEMADLGAIFNTILMKGQENAIRPN